MDQAQTGIKLVGRNISNLRYADDIFLMAESKEDVRTAGSDLGTFVRTEGRVGCLLPTATETASFPASLALMETSLSLINIHSAGIMG